LARAVDDCVEEDERMRSVTSRLVAAVGTAAVALAISGCGSSDPYLKPQATNDTAKPPIGGDPREPPEERLGARPTENDDTPAGSPTPEAAIRRYAILSINWTAATLADRQRTLAQLSVGAARQGALLAAQQVARDSTLQKSARANHGQVVAVVAGTGPVSGRWVVVTRETAANGDDPELPPGFHVTVAAAQRVASGWAVSAWEPES
jgi:hypothetical protein